MIRTALKVIFTRETDGRWIAEVEALPGVLAYGATPGEAERNVRALAARVLSRPPGISS